MEMHLGKLLFCRLWIFISMACVARRIWEEEKNPETKLWPQADGLQVFAGSPGSLKPYSPESLAVFTPLEHREQPGRVGVSFSLPSESFGTLAWERWRRHTRRSSGSPAARDPSRWLPGCHLSLSGWTHGALLL